MSIETPNTVEAGKQLVTPNAIRQRRYRERKQAELEALRLATAERNTQRNTEAEKPSPKPVSRAQERIEKLARKNAELRRENDRLANENDGLLALNAELRGLIIGRAR